MAYTDREDANYVGQLFSIGAHQTPFLNMIGGLNGGRVVSSFLFPVAQPYALSGASQDTQSEATAAAEGTPVTVTRGQDYNTCQIMKKDAEVSYAKQSTPGDFAGIQVVGNQPVQDELSFQKAVQLRQLAIDVEYSFFKGAYVAPNAASTNQTTRGIEAAIATNSVAAGSTDLTKAWIDEVLRTMAANGAEFVNMIAYMNAFQKQMMSDIYGFAPTDRNVGGLNIKQVETDFCMLGIVYAPQATTSVVDIVDIAFCRPVFCPYKGQRISWTDKGPIAAKKGGFWYTQVGLDYGPEEYHGEITGLNTS